VSEGFTDDVIAYVNQERAFTVSLAPHQGRSLLIVRARPGSNPAPAENNLADSTLHAVGGPGWKRPAVIEGLIPSSAGRPTDRSAGRSNRRPVLGCHRSSGWR
jgi:hypothetical protein